MAAIMIVTAQLAQLYSKNDITAICVLSGGMFGARKSGSLGAALPPSDRYGPLDAHVG